MIQSSDIVYVLSGGANNTDSAASLGGDPSASPILAGANNLFDNVAQADATAGNTDYRCMYVFNNSLVDTLWNASVFAQGDVAGGSIAQFGMAFSDEVQNLTVIGNVTSGTLTMSYEGHNFTFSYSSTLSVWIANFQSALRSVPNLAEVQISAQTSTSVDNQAVTVFTILYTGSSAGNRFHPILTLVANAMTPIPVVSASRSIGGSPINSITTIIDHSTTTPSGIIFGDATAEAPLRLGDLRPTDGFPVWIKRTTPPGSLPLAGDGFKTVVAGTAFP